MTAEHQKQPSGGEDFTANERRIEWKRYQEANLAKVQKILNEKVLPSPTY
jgi:hypothetical protein